MPDWLRPLPGATPCLLNKVNDVVLCEETRHQSASTSYLQYTIQNNVYIILLELDIIYRYLSEDRLCFHGNLIEESVRQGLSC